MAQMNGVTGVDQQETAVKMGNVRGANAPHFMSPTIASKLSQAKAPDKRPTTPVSIKSVRSDRGQSLLLSAVQRVGRRRAATDNSTPGKNQSPTKYNRTILFPDKLSTPLHTDQSSSPLTTPKHKSKEKPPSPLDKPLPALPKTRLNNTESVKPSVSVSEIANGRIHTSTRDTRPSDEPVDFKPSQTLQRDSLQTMMARTGRELMQQSSLNERYPVLGNTTRQRQSSQHPPIVSRYSPKAQGTLGRLSSTAAQKPAVDTGSVLSSDLMDPFKGAGETSKYHPTTEDDQNLSAAAAALEKSVSETRTDQTPRQTRTTSLRARLSAGQLVKNSQNKVLGFTDFTVSRASTDSLNDSERDDSVGSRNEQTARHLNGVIRPSLQGKGSKSTLHTKASLHSMHSNLSTESLIKGHAPAQFVGGSRRTNPGQRPVSRNSSRSVSREPNSISANRQSQASTTLPSKSLISNSENADIEGQAKSRKSSLPVPTHGALNAMFKPQSVSSSVSRKPAQVNVAPRIEVTVQQDQSSADLSSDHLEPGAKSAFRNRGPTQIFNDAQEYKSLKAIEESPQQKFTLKRLSVKAPEYGPKLRISSSAERFIMGDNNDKENQVVPGKLSKKFFQRSTNGIHKQQRNTAYSAPAFNRQPGRPVSIHETPQSSPRDPTFIATFRERKVKSADMGSMLSTDMPMTYDPSRQNTDASKNSEASSNDQSFFSAQEDGSQPANDSVQIDQSQNSSKVLFDKATCNSSSQETTDGTKQDAPSDISSTTSTPVVSPLDSLRPERTSPQSPTKAPNSDLDINTTPKSSISNVTVKHMPFTPLDTIGKTSSRPSRHHPPRSSSRVVQPHFTTSPSSSEQAISEKTPPTPPKDENRQENIQNSLGSRHEHTSWQVDIADLASKHNSILHDKAIKGNGESESTPTTAKKSFSSFRNLFNKRTPFIESKRPNISKGLNSSSSTKAKQPKQKVKKTLDTSTSSPHTPLPSKNRHPSHRSTVSSSIRTTPSRPRSNLTMATASPASTIITPASATAVATPASLGSPASTTISASTNLAMNLLDAARAERSSPKKEKLLQMSKILVDALTQARDAEKAAEEAKMASRRAEMAKEICGKMVEEVGRAIGEWSGTVLESDHE